MKRSTGLAARAVAGLVTIAFAAPRAWACGSSCGSGADHSRHSGREIRATPEQARDSSYYGGQVSTTANYQFETLFAPDGIRIYAYASDGSPLQVEGVSGSVVLEFGDGTFARIPLLREQPVSQEKSVYFCPMHPEVVQAEPGTCPTCGGMKLYVQDRLYAKKDLSGDGDRYFKVVASIRGLADEEESVTFNLAHGVPPAAATEGPRVRSAPQEAGHSGH